MDRYIIFKDTEGYGWDNYHSVHQSYEQAEAAAIDLVRLGLAKETHVVDITKMQIVLQSKHVKGLNE